MIELVLIILVMIGFSIYFQFCELKKKDAEIEKWKQRSARTDVIYGEAIDGLILLTRKLADEGPIDERKSWRQSLILLQRGREKTVDAFVEAAYKILNKNG